MHRTAGAATADELAQLAGRTGARTTAAVPQRVRDLLDAGVLETVNLSEWLIVDHGRLAQLAADALAEPDLPARYCAQLPTEKKATAPVRLHALAAAVAEICTADADWEAAFSWLLQHPSDSLRGTACLLLSRRRDLGFNEHLRRMRPLAADRNMSVRELAWMAIRPGIAADLHGTIQLLGAWVASADANIRRCACEATRPRGVWCRALPELRRDPQPGLPLLERLRSDTSPYVRTSVGNWLNDAAKDNPDWVRAVCARWLDESPTQQTQWIVRHGLRTLRKSASPTQRN